MDYATCDGWARTGQRYHFFRGIKSLCGNQRRPKYAHPTPPIQSESCEPCWYRVFTPKIEGSRVARSDEWEEIAAVFIYNYALLHQWVMIDAVRDAGLPHPPGDDQDFRLSGPIFLKLARKGVLQKTGRTYLSSFAHGAPREIWESLIFRNEKR